MPGPLIADPTPSWLKPENASVTDSSLTKALRMIGHLIGADNPTAQVFGLMMSEIPSGPSGGLSGVLERLIEKGQAIKAYHGSPHDFERFSMEKIGTGEGAQAYGHGLYFAENPATAQNYAKNLSSPVPTRLYVDGQRQTFQESAEKAFGKQAADAIQSLSNIEHKPETWEGIAAKLREKGHTVEIQHGNTYEVAIKADPESFLDYDKPVREQPEQIRNAVAKAMEQLRAQGKEPSEYHELIGTPHGSAALKQFGVSGIKYLDQGSRAIGEGSRNYVVFDDSLIDILKKYGWILPAAGVGAEQDQR